MDPRDDIGCSSRKRDSTFRRLPASPSRMHAAAIARESYGFLGTSRIIALCKFL